MDAVVQREQKQQSATTRYGRRLNARIKAKHSGEGEGDVKMETGCGMRRKGSGPRRGKKETKAGTRESGSAALSNDAVAM
jgi:hypothetical protein